MHGLTIWEWFKRFFTGEPHFIVYADHEEGVVPQLLRWWVIPRNRFFNIYLHKTVRDDEDRALHDHPWDSVSFLLAGRLGEYIFQRPELMSDTHYSMSFLEDFQAQKPREIPRFLPVFRKAEYAHRLYLPDPEKPSWTLFITGPKKRKWGFFCQKRWVRWEQFCQIGNPGIPKGCGEN